MLVCGGRGGAMEAACRGAKEAGGADRRDPARLDRSDANPFVDVVVPTGLGEARNALVVGAADVVIAVGGGYGTLSEIALALKAGKRVIGLGTWEIEGVRGGRGPPRRPSRRRCPGLAAHRLPVRHPPTWTRCATAERDPVRLHVPGHKGGAGADPRLVDAIGERALALDIPALM